MNIQHKVELHAHLSGCLRRSTLLEFLNEKDDSFLNDSSLEGCFRIFAKINSINLTSDKLKRIVQEVLEDFEKDGVTYLELRTTPKKGEDFNQMGYVRIVDNEISQYKGKMQVKLIICLDRAKGPDIAMQTRLFMMRNKFSNIVGVDLCGNPILGNFNDYWNELTIFREMGYKITIHAGETVDNIKENDDILSFKPERLGHFLYHTEEQLQKVKELGIMIEVCFSSNIQGTGMLPTDHPVQKFIKNQIPISICTDDTLLFRTTVTQEIQLIQKTFSLSNDIIEKIKQDSYSYRFV